MNMKARKPIPQANTQVDLSKAETIKCESCGTHWMKPVNYFIQFPHPAIANLVESYRKKISKCI